MGGGRGGWAVITLILNKEGRHLSGWRALQQFGSFQHIFPTPPPSHPLYINTVMVGSLVIPTSQIYIRSTVVHGFPHFGQLHWFPVPFPFLSLSPSLEDEMLLQLFSWL